MLTQITRNIMYLNFYILKFLNFKIFFYCLNDFENCNFYIKQTIILRLPVKNKRTKSFYLMLFICEQF